MTRKPIPSALRAGFTLVELLVVIAIIGIIMALAGVAYFYFVSAQGIRNTQAKIQGIHEVFQNHWKKVRHDAENEDPSPAVKTLAGGNGPRAQVIWVKARLAEAFPMTFAEITSPQVYTTGLIPPDKQKNNATYKKMLASAPAIANNKAETQSAACLFMALSINRLGGNETVDFDRWKYDSDNDGLFEFVDDYYKPLVFFRFPTDNADLQSSAPAKVGAASKLRDPLDPQGTLVNPGWYGTPFRTNFETIFHPIKASSGVVHYTVPVIASSGPDTLLGLAPGTMAVTNPNQTVDNIYSFSLQVGGGTKQ